MKRRPWICIACCPEFRNRIRQYRETPWKSTFYLSGAIAIAATLMVITDSSAVHALLYLIVSLLAVAIVFYVLGAPFVGGTGSHHLRGRDHGAVRVRDDDA